MECPHCHQAVEAPEDGESNLVECQACNAVSMPDAQYCHGCGASLTGEDLTDEGLEACEACGHSVGPDDNYCADCGSSLRASSYDDDQDADISEAPASGGSKKRKACSDGMCIGIIGPDGKCTECGKAYEEPIE